MKKIVAEHYEIISSNNKISKKMILLCKNSYNKNKLFFKGNSKKFKITIAHTENEFKKALGRKYSPWVKGWAKEGGNIIIRDTALNKDCYKKFGGTKDISLVLVHEINHVFACERNLYKGPYWLFEGIAIHVAGQKMKNLAQKVNSKRVKTFLNYRVPLKKRTIEGYGIYNKATEYLIKRYGIQKLRALFKTYKKTMKKKDFERNFKKIYSLNYKDFCQEIINQF